MLRAFQLGYLELVSAQLDQEVRHYERIIGETLVDQAGGTAISVSASIITTSPAPGPDWALSAFACKLKSFPTSQRSSAAWELGPN
jgi:hypothetical protein